MNPETLQSEVDELRRRRGRRLWFSQKFLKDWRLARSLAWRLSFSRRQLFSTPNIISLAGLALGVACLTTAMGVVSGFESTLRSAITEVAGDIIVYRKSIRATSHESFVQAMKARAPFIEAATPYVNLEAVIAGHGKSAGIIIQGLDSSTLHTVLNLKPRVIAGEFDISENGDIPRAAVGKGLAKNFGLKIGDVFRVVIPLPSKTDSSRFEPKLQSFKLSAMLDLGRVEYDDRSVLVDLKVAQRLGGLGENLSGWRLKLDSPDHAHLVASQLGSLEGIYAIPWYEVSANLIEAIQLERPVIFLVIFIMVIAAAFNVSSQLFISVLARYPDMSVLRAIGLTSEAVKRVFIWQGVLIGVVGVVLGNLLGFLFLGICRDFAP
jgi:lipoprotein-releasing system permease protein